MRPIPAWTRRSVALLTLALAAALLGLPPRPTLAVGAVDPAAATAFVRDALRLLLTVAVWYLLVTAAVAAAATLPGIGAPLRPLARRLTDAGLGVILRRVLATSAVVGVSLPGAAAAGSSDADQVPPTMVPVHPSQAARDTPRAGGHQPIRQVERAADAATDRSGREGAPARPDGQDDGQPGASGSPAAAAQPAAAADVPRMRSTEQPADRHEERDHEPNGSETPTMAREPETVPSSPADADGRSDDQVHGGATAPSARVDGARPPTHVVARGESFWTIAEDLVRARPDLGGETTDLDTIAGVWQRLVDRNADILVDPGNPDLLHRGQVIDLTDLS